MMSILQRLKRIEADTVQQQEEEKARKAVAEEASSQPSQESLPWLQGGGLLCSSKQKDSSLEFRVPAYRKVPISSLVWVKYSWYHPKKTVSDP